MNYASLLKLGQEKLYKKKIRNPALDCEVILSHMLKIERASLLLNLDKIAKKTEITKFFENVCKRENKIPVSYITGQKDFWKSTFNINNSVLIPRPDTELLVEECLKLISKNSSKKILDIGTGSGCIIISILLERLKCKGIGLDISKEAIKIARINAKMQHLENRINFINSDIDNFFSNKYDLIVSNPPYIDKFKLRNLDEDVRLSEPLDALDGGPGGYSKIIKVIKKSNNLLRTKGFLLLEIDKTQYLGVKKLLRKNGFYNYKICKDLGNNTRCIISQKI